MTIKVKKLNWLETKYNFPIISETATQYRSSCEGNSFSVLYLEDSWGCICYIEDEYAYIVEDIFVRLSYLVQGPYISGFDDPDEAKKFCNFLWENIATNKLRNIIED